MDTGEYDTNTLLLKNISSIAFRVYESSPDQSPTYPSPALELESTLRENGHIVVYDPSRRGIWHFQLLYKDGDGDIEIPSDDKPEEVERYAFVLADEGTFEPTSVQRGRLSAHPSGTTPTSATSGGSALELSQRASFSQGSAPNSQDHDLKVPASSAGDAKPAQTQNKAVYENFIAAVLLTMSSTFCATSGATPLDYRTVLLPLRPPTGVEATSEQDPVVGTFTAYMTTTGSLVIRLNASYCKGLTSCQDSDIASSPVSTSRKILAAPFGVLGGDPAPSEPGTASLAQTPITQVLSIRGSSDIHDSLWKQACVRALEFRGINPSTLQECSWLSVSVPRRRLQDAKADSRRSIATTVVPWPSPLCFRRKSVQVSMTSCVGDTLLSGHDENHDALGNAGTWFNTAAERDDKAAKRKLDRDAATAKEVDGNDSRGPKASAHTPFTLGRPNTASAGAMYPTPPDGIQHLNGVTPSFDGTLSSPGNAPSTTAIADVETTMPSTSSAGDGFADGWDTSEPKRERSESNALGDAENMFGDMGGDMFSDNDITEADFSFFDEQPGEVDLDLSMGELSATEETPRPQSVPKAEDMQDVVDVSPPELQSRQKSPVFAKPELKHARSSLVEDATAAIKPEGKSAVKREASPFSPDTVFKRVRASFASPKQASDSSEKSSRRAKNFEKVSFDPILPMINKKYEPGGLFDYSGSVNKKMLKLEPGTLPETEYLKRHGKSGRRLRDRQLSAGTLLNKLALVSPTVNPSPNKVDDSISDGDASSVESDQDDSSYTSDEPNSPFKPSVRRANVDEDTVSQVLSLRDADPIEEPDQHLAMELPRLSKPEQSDMLLSKLFSVPEPLPLDLSLADDDVIQIAQLMTEQAATGSLKIFSCQGGEDVSLARRRRHDLAAEARDALSLLHRTVGPFLTAATPSHLKSLLEVQDVPLVGQPRGLQPRPVPGRDPNAEQLRPSSLYQIPGTHLEVRRADTKMSVLPSAISFWETLGLAPSSGSKDVHAVCVFPSWKGLADNVNTFLDRVKSVYELLKLGSFDKLTISDDFESDGILQYELDRISTSPSASVAGYGSTLMESMETLRGALSNFTTVETNIVIYFVYSPANPATIVEACVAFQRFFEIYKKLLSTKRDLKQNELVLQLVSEDIISSPTSLVVTTPAELVSLCMETYDRCTIFDAPMPAPAIMLEQPLPRIIDFKLTHSPSASLIHENSCIHVAYARSVDDRWVTAAWTDDRGNQQATASYCLGKRGRPLSTSMHEVAHEIWESTLDLISVWKVHWRVIITKSGPLEPLEIEFWADLARTESKANVTMVLMTVDTKPSLQLLPPTVKLPHSTTSFYATPVSTPQNSVVSPEQTTTPTPATPVRDPGTGAAATPAADPATDADADSVLIDVTDQTWGAVVGHRLSNSTTLLEVQAALVSGYLIKRTGASPHDPPVLMEVNLVHTDAAPRTYEPLLREMLSHFRGLGTLARARGVVGKEGDVRPWHIAAAEKAVHALYMLM